VDDSSIPIAEMGRKRMLNLETQTQIRHWFYAEHWKVGTIAQQLGVHPDAVRRALQDGSSRREPALRHCLTDPYVCASSNYSRRFRPRASRVGVSG
jgi:IS30 family transposase